jgi:hypothetical protein
MESSVPLLFIFHVDDDDDVASFDLTTINSPFKDLLHSSISFGESLRRVVPLEMKIQVQEGIAAQVKYWKELKAATLDH